MKSALVGRLERNIAVSVDSALLLGYADHCLFSRQAFAV